MKKITKVLAGLLIVGMFFACKNNNVEKPEEKPQSDPQSDKPAVEEKVEAVTFGVAAGEVEEFTAVALSTKTADAVIYYEFVEGQGTATLTPENFKADGIAVYSAPVEIGESGTIYAVAVKGNKVSALSSAAYTTVAPADAVRNWDAEKPSTAMSVYKYSDLEKLAEIVNGGNALSGVTITQKKDIAINKSVLGEKFVEPAEAEECKPNADLINFAGIGNRKSPFAGNYDGNKKIISGLYIYGDHQGLGFFGSIKNSTIKNVIIVDSCVINNNESAAGDGNDDDRFGGLIGMTIETSEDAPLTDSIENCIFVGTLGSEAALNRGGAYEYIAGMIGQISKYTTVSMKNCYSLVNLNGTSVAALVKSVKGKVNCEDCYGVQIAKAEGEENKVYTNDSKKVVLNAEDGISKATVIEAIKTNCGIDLTDYFTKAGL